MGTRQVKAYKPFLKIIQHQGDGFRFSSSHFDKESTPADQKKHMVDALKQALASIE